MKTVTKVILPIVALMGVIFVISYVRNYTADKPGDEQVEEEPDFPLTMPTFIVNRDTIRNLPSFRFLRDEYEVGEGGQFDFWFLNENEKTITVRLDRTSCNCSWIDVGVVRESAWGEYLENVRSNAKIAAVVGLLDPAGIGPLIAAPLVELTHPDKEHFTWTRLDPTSPQVDRGNAGGELSATIPAAPDADTPRAGILRMNWNATKVIDRNVLEAGMYAKVEDGDEHYQPFLVTIIGVPSVIADPLELDFGVLHEGESKTLPVDCFSLTRRLGEFEPIPRLRDPEPCITFSEPRPLTPDEREQLRTKLAENRDGRSTLGPAYRIDVTVHANRDGHTMDLGPFSRSMRVVSKENVDTADERAITVALTGGVEGFARLLTPDREQVIRLGAGFPNNVRRKVEFRLLTDEPGTEVKVLSTTPSFLVADVVPETDREWTIRVEVPPHKLFGTLPRGSEIVFEVNPPGQPARNMRLPVRGESVDVR